MDVDIFDALNYLTGSTKTSAKFRLCDFNTITDLINFNDNSIDKMEEYIQLQCSLMGLDERSLYLDGDDIQNPKCFMISPGLRNRIFKAVSTIVNSFNGISSVSYQKSINSNYINYGIKDSVVDRKNIKPLSIIRIPDNKKFMVQKSLNRFSNNNIQTKTTFIKSRNSLIDVAKSSPDVSKSIIQPSKKIDRRISSNCKKSDKNLMELVRTNCYETIATDQSLNFDNCDLVPKRDFDIEIKVNEKSFINSKFYYDCKLCGGKLVKFNLNKDLKPIQTGIKSHNRTHFSTKSSFIPTNFRRKSSLLIEENI